MEERIAVIALGYVGLPVALAFARRFPGTVGFDVDEARVASLRDCIDGNGDVDPSVLDVSTLEITTDPRALSGATFFVVAVPTPVDPVRQPDLGPVLKASEGVGAALSRGSVVVYESTVYPGMTEEVCGPALERASGLLRGVHFKLGYSAERIRPGECAPSHEKIVNVVAGGDAETQKRVARVYGAAGSP